MKKQFVAEPQDKIAFTRTYDRWYSQFARWYVLAVRMLPFWRRWLRSVLPHVRGQTILEISFGTGYLLPFLARRSGSRICALEYNSVFLRRARDILRAQPWVVSLQQGDVHALPYADQSFDCIINTMAFSGYPDGQRALMEMRRILKPEGRLLMVDVAYPQQDHFWGMCLTKLWITMGDILRDMPVCFEQCGFSYEDTEIGAGGSVHLYIARKMAANP